MREDDFRQIANFIDEGVQLSIEAKKKSGMTGWVIASCDIMWYPGGGNLKQVNQLLETDKDLQDKIAALKDKVEKFAVSFTIPGYPDVWIGTLIFIYTT